MATPSASKINSDFSTDNVIPIGREIRRARRTVSRAHLDPNQIKPLPANAEVQKWWRMQISVRLLDWLLDHLDPKLAKRSLKLMIASQKLIPAGCLPDDDEFLAGAAGYGNDVETWLKVKDRVLADIWFQRQDGLWQCAALTEGIASAMSRRGKPDRSRNSMADSEQPEDDSIPF